MLGGFALHPDSKSRHWREDEAKAAGLLTEVEVLNSLRDGQPKTYADIAAKFGKEKEAAYGACDKLYAKGLLTRTLNADKRRIFVLLNAKGVAVFKERRGDEEQNSGRRHISTGEETGIAV